MNRTGRLVSFKVAVLLYRCNDCLLWRVAVVAQAGNDLSGDGSNGGQSNPPVLTVPSDAFCFLRLM